MSEPPNPALQSYALAERKFKGSSVRRFEESQEEGRKVESVQQRLLVQRAEREAREREKLRELKRQDEIAKARQKSINKQLKKERKAERKAKRLESKAKYVTEKRRERRINTAYQQERGLHHDGARFVGRALGFAPQRSAPLTSRERIERQIANEEKKLQRLRDKLMGI